MPLLSKSKYMIGLQCPRYLWMAAHQPDKIPEPDLATQHRFDEGHQVHQWAKELFPGGIDLPEGPDKFKENIEKTKELLPKKKILFEAGIKKGEIYSRADVLVPVKDKWDVVEVKMGTSVKDENIHDLSFQKYVYQQAGLKIRKCYLMHLNNEYVRKGKIDVKKLFVQEDLTGMVDEAVEGIEGRVKAMLEVLALNKPPSAEISTACTSPYVCPLEDCWKFLPESNVFHLYRIGRKAFKLVEMGVHALGDVPADFKLNDRQGIQVQGEKSSKVHVDKGGIKGFLGSLEKPLYYLDFETFGTAVPLFDGVKPYQPVPFQFSLHVDDGTSLKHYGFLAEGKEDPREKFISELKKVLGKEGSIIVYNQGFEKRVLKSLGERFPEHRKWVKEVSARMGDLWAVFRNFHYYNPKQKGSASLKDVLPAVTGKSYEGLAIADGDEASINFLDITFGEVSEEERKKVREDLEKYCSLDTEGMVWIVEELEGLVRKV